MQTDSSAISTWRASRSASEYTATVRMPILRAVLMTRQAISPRFAISIFLNMFSPGSFELQRNISVLAPRILKFLALQHGQRAADALARFVRHDDVVNEAAAAGDEGVGELLAIFLGALGDL